MKRFFSNSLFALLTLASVACGPSAKLGAPAGFAHVDGDYDDRVTSARGVVIGARVESNDPKANLEFWAEAIDLRLRAKGYVVEDAKDIKSDNGIPGRGLRYTYFDGTRQNRYWLDVFATDRHVVLVEAAGDKGDFDAAKETVEKTMLGVRFD